MGTRIVADTDLALLDETFGTHGPLRRVSGRDLGPGLLRDADVLLVRSVTRVGPELLADSSVRFVGTATIGTDHLDIPWLEANGIHWAHAPGCNADAAAEYTLGMMVLACSRMATSLESVTVGIVGLGNVGSRLARLLDALQVPWVACDPLLADTGVAGLVGLDTALQQDIVSLHVPLTRDGSHPTFRMLDARRLATMRTGSLLVNAARGDVVDATALLAELRSGRLHAALDVWPGEPDIDPELLRASLVASPHVAGYSVEGKREGALAIYRQFLDWRGLGGIPRMPPLRQQRLELGADRNSLAGILERICGIGSTELTLRAALEGAETPPEAFEALRRDYPLRHDFSAWKLRGVHPCDRPRLEALGLHCD